MEGGPSKETIQTDHVTREDLTTFAKTIVEKKVIFGRPVIHLFCMTYALKLCYEVGCAHEFAV